ncbi:MAG: PaaI family thioesterase [Acidimicrobiales bacterium]
MAEGIDLDTAGSRTVHGTLGIETVEATADRVVLRLPVTSRVHQPYGLLHGGVSALMAESAASYGAGLAAPPGHHVVGIELNASHLRPMRDGVLTATATPVRRGRTVQVWEVSLTDDGGQEICRSRCTLAVIADAGTSDGREP